MHRWAASSMLLVWLGSPQAAASPGFPAGNGWVSKTPRLPKWPAVFEMNMSTILMPCNASGMHSTEEALRYGIVSYDWANAKGVWGKHTPMDDEEYLVKQADLVIAANTAAGGSTRVGTCASSHAPC